MVFKGYGQALGERDLFGRSVEQYREREREPAPRLLLACGAGLK